MRRLMIAVFLLMCCFAGSVHTATFNIEVGTPKPRIITPTAANQTVSIRIDSNNMDSMPAGRIFDITGREVARMSVAGDIFNDGYGFLTWTPSADVPAGVYIYQIEKEDYIYNGAIVVAR